MDWLQCPADASVIRAWQGELHQQTQALLLRGLNSNFICCTVAFPACKRVESNVLQRVQFLLHLAQLPLRPVNMVLNKQCRIRAHRFATESL